jgi:hypothetical protein
MATEQTGHGVSSIQRGSEKNEVEIDMEKRRENKKEQRTEQLGIIYIVL